MKVLPHADIPTGSEALKWRQFGEADQGEDSVADPVIEFFDELKPHLYAMKALGLFPLQKQIADGSTFRRCRLSLAYSVVFYAGMSVYACCVSLERIQAVKSSETEFDELLFSVVHFLYVLPHFYLIPCHWVEVGKVGAYFSLWNDFQKEFLLVTGRPLYLGQRKRSLFATLAVPFLVGGYFLLELFLVVPDYRVWELGFYVYIFISLTLHVTWFWLVCSALRGAMRAYNDNFLQDRSLLCESSVSQYRLLWISLARLSRETGMFMSFTYGHLCVIAFTIMTLQLYGSLSNMQNAMYLRHLGLALCVTMTAGIVYLTADSAHLAASEISGDFVEKLTRLCSCDKQVRRELKIFTQATAVISADINLGGYVNYNRGFLLNFIATMVTYLIVLLQFRLSILSISDPSNVTQSADVRVLK